MQGTITKFGYIDTLRGIAILMVIAVHSALNLPQSSLFIRTTALGQMGVQLFFVASALTLCLSAQMRGLIGSGVGEFFIRRYFRIAPMYYLGIGLYLCLNILLQLKGVPNDIGKYSISTILSNIFLCHGLIPAGNNSVVPGGWSIGTEMLFYLLFPFLFRFCSRMNVGRIVLVLLGNVLMLFLVSFLIWHFKGKQVVNNSFFYFSIFNQLPVFLCGIILYKIISDRDMLIKVKLYYVLGVMLISGIGFEVFWYNYSTYSFICIALFSGIFFSCLAFLFHFYSITNKVIELIGQRSFSIYVVHSLICVYGFPLFRMIFDSAGINSPFLMFIIIFLVTILISFGSATLTYRFVEKPFIKKGNEVAKWFSDIVYQRVKGTAEE